MVISYLYRCRKQKTLFSSKVLGHSTEIYKCKYSPSDVIFASDNFNFQRFIVEKISKTVLTRHCTVIFFLHHYVS